MMGFWGSLWGLRVPMGFSQSLGGFGGGPYGVCWSRWGLMFPMGSVGPWGVLGGGPMGVLGGVPMGFWGGGPNGVFRALDGGGPDPLGGGGSHRDHCGDPNGVQGGLWGFGVSLMGICFNWGGGRRRSGTPPGSAVPALPPPGSGGGLAPAVPEVPAAALRGAQGALWGAPQPAPGVRLIGVWERGGVSGGLGEGSYEASGGPVDSWGVL